MKPALGQHPTIADRRGTMPARRASCGSLVSQDLDIAAGATAAACTGRAPGKLADGPPPARTAARTRGERRPHNGCDMDITAGITVAACALAGLAAGGVVSAAVTWLPGWPPGTLRGAWRCPDCAAGLRLANLIPVTGWRALPARCPAGDAGHGDRALTGGPTGDPGLPLPSAPALSAPTQPAPAPSTPAPPAAALPAAGPPAIGSPDPEMPVTMAPADEQANSRRADGRWTVAAGLITVVAVVAMGLRFGAQPVLPAYCYLAAVSVALAVIDARCQRLPDALTLPSYPVALIALGVAAAFTPDGWRHLLSALAGLAACWLVFLAQALVYPAGIGWGDVKLSGLAGAYLGWLGLHAVIDGVVLGYLLALVAGAGLLIARRATGRTRLAFGPYLLAGTLTVIVLSGVAAGLRGPLL